MIVQAMPYPAGGGGGPFGAHAYWRVLVADNWGDTSYITIGTLEFQDASGTPIAATGGTALTSSTNATYPPANAFDAPNTSWWRPVSGNVTNQHLGYHFPAPVSVAKVRLDKSASGTDLPRNCSLQYSDDGASWTTAFSFLYLYVNDANNNQVFDGATLASGYHHMWRVFVVDANGAGVCGIGEIELRATASGADQVPAMSNSNQPGFRVFADSANVAAPAWHGFRDDGSTNGWQSDSGSTNHYIAVVCATAIKVQEVALTCAYLDATRMGKTMRLDYSDDGGVTWTTQKNFAAQTGWSVGETRVLSAIGSAPSFSVAPSVSPGSGPYYVDDTLFAVAGTHDGLSSTYQWNRNSAPISGATASSYSLQSADIGQSITLSEIATKDGLQTTAPSSAITGITAGSGYSLSTGYAVPYTGGRKQFTVPAGATSAEFKLWGGGGSGGRYGTGTSGGGGGFSTGLIAVSPGDLIVFQAAQGGQKPASTSLGGAGGWPDGGGGSNGDTNGGGGGGSSRIWKNGVLVAVAGGGGGSGGYSGGGTAGAGGGTSGQNATSSGGLGGTSSAGGADSNDTGNATKKGLQLTSETNRTGGWGNNTGTLTTSTSDDGGGGGGGYWGGGGGGGDGASGGGGSGYVSGATTSSSTTAGSGATAAGTGDANYPGGGVGGGGSSHGTLASVTAGGNGAAWIKFT